MNSEFEAELQDGVDLAQVVHHIASARHILKNLRAKVDDAERRGEFEEAITKLDIVLSHLMVGTGGMV